MRGKSIVAMVERFSSSVQFRYRKALLMSDLHGEQYLSPESEQFIDSFFATQKGECEMSKRVKEVSFNPDETQTVNMLLQDEIMRLAESRDWFDRHNVEMPDREKHDGKIENLLSMRNRLTCLLIEGAGVNDSKYVLRHVSGKDS